MCYQFCFWKVLETKDISPNMEGLENKGQSYGQYEVTPNKNSTPKAWSFPNWQYSLYCYTLMLGE